MRLRLFVAGALPYSRGFPGFDIAQAVHHAGAELHEARPFADHAPPLERAVGKSPAPGQNLLLQEHVRHARPLDSRMQSSETKADRNGAVGESGRGVRGGIRWDLRRSRASGRNRRVFLRSSVVGSPIPCGAPSQVDLSTTARHWSDAPRTDRAAERTLARPRWSSIREIEPASAASVELNEIAPVRLCLEHVDETLASPRAVLDELLVLEPW